MNTLQIDPVFYTNSLIQSLSNNRGIVIMFFLMND